MWPDTRLCQLLGIDHPIIQAPMAGTTTPAMAAAVSEAGGLGSHGCAALDEEALTRDLARVRQLTEAPVNFNFFCHQPPAAPDAATHEAIVQAMQPHYDQAGLRPPQGAAQAPYPPFGASQLGCLLDQPPRVVSFHFGLPEGGAVAALKAEGVRILASATTVAEARWLEDRGVDAVIAQGWEAGGHRGCFLDLEHDPEIGLMALLPQVADAVRVPVIAAGGIADGRGIAAAFALGASGVQIGTAFIDCEESAAPVQHRAAVASGRDDSTRVSRAFSGRPARGHRTGYSDAMRGRPHAPFPLHYHYLAPLRAADPDTYQVSLYGQAAALALAGGAAERLTALVGDAQARLHRG